MENRRSRCPNSTWKQWYLWPLVPAPYPPPPPSPGNVRHQHDVFHVFPFGALASTTSSQGRQKCSLTQIFVSPRPSLAVTPSLMSSLISLSYKLLQLFLYVSLMSRAAFCLVFLLCLYACFISLTKPQTHFL